MKAVQLDMFEINKPAAAPKAPVGPVILNGFYYERATNKYVSFVLGKRYYEESAKGCRYPKDWQEMLKRERAI